MNILSRHKVEVSGNGEQPIIMLHGFGCNRSMWRHLTPLLESDYRIITFDHAGTTEENVEFYNTSRYTSLDGYAEDIVDICRALELEDAIFVGHSVSAMMGVLAYHRAPDLFSALVMVGPSPCYINKEDYRGGFEHEDIEELMHALEANYLGWSANMAPAIIGNPDRPELGQELTDSFCRMHPDVAQNFARVTFFSDNREDLQNINIPTLILQTKEDIIAQPEVGRYVHNQIKNSEFVLLDTTGHLPHLSAPQATNAAIMQFLHNLRGD